jgi:hypothetical protein
VTKTNVFATITNVFAMKTIVSVTNTIVFVVLETRKPHRGIRNVNPLVEAANTVAKIGHVMAGNL